MGTKIKCLPNTMYFTLIYSIALMNSRWVEAKTNDKSVSDFVSPNTNQEGITEVNKSVHEMLPDSEHQMKEMHSGVQETIQNINHDIKETSSIRPQDNVKSVHEMLPDSEHQMKEMHSRVSETFQNIHHDIKETSSTRPQDIVKSAHELVPNSEHEMNGMHSAVHETFQNIHHDATEADSTGSQEDEKSVVTEGEIDTTELLPAPSKEPRKDYTYKVFDSKEELCLLAKFQAVFTITYPSKDGEQNVAVNLPVDTDVKGRCGDTASPFLQLIWSEFVFNMSFSKLPSKDDTTEWAVTSLKLQYDTADPLLDGATNEGKKIARSKNIEVFQTPVGKSYFCQSPERINLYHSNKQVATAKLTNVHLQPFDVHGAKFSQEHRCNQVIIDESIEPFVQDETVPLAVGSTLAVLTLLIIIGFSVYRAVTVRKVDYNTME